MQPYTPTALPDPSHWAVMLGLVTLVLFLARAAWKDLHRPDRVPDDAGPDPRVPLFRETIASLWLVCVVAVASWFLGGGGHASLGFVPGDGWGGGWAWAGAVLGSGLLALQWRSLDRSEEVRERYAAQIDAAKGYDWVRPTTPKEYRLFMRLAVTAGITEEVIFRGFLIGVLSSWLPLWVAGGAALIVFVGAHVYQGLSGMMRILPVSTVLTVLFLISGSLLPGILLHIAVDVAGGALMWKLRDRRGGSAGEGGEDGEGKEATAIPPERPVAQTRPIRSHS